MYIESANYLITWGQLDSGFIYMPGYVLLISLLKALGGELLSVKMIGVVAGSLAAAATFGIARHLVDRRAAWLAGLCAALWPAGVAIASVTGTDMPATALIAVALWALVAWGPHRPRRACVAFGLLMGLAAYIRAVAFPLCAMSAFYWIALWAKTRHESGRGLGWMAVTRTVLVRTALAGAVALLMITPWAVRNRIRNGDLRFTDYHGGITALIGANPNSEGTYTRALNELFTRTTGRWVLAEPHGPVDDDAFALAREWSRWEPGYALGLLIKKAEQLFDSEYRLLYWPIDRPGVLQPPHSTWFAVRAAMLHRLADVWWTVLIGCYAAGVALALVRRRWLALVVLPFQGALACTYIGFFAEPRYRLPIELLAYPVAASTVIWCAELRRLSRPHVFPWKQAAAAVAAVTLLWVGWPTLLNAGAELRRTHRWGTSVCSVLGSPAVCKWKRSDAPHGESPLRGAPDAVGIEIRPRRPAAVAMELAGNRLTPGEYDLSARLAWEASGAPGDGGAPPALHVQTGGGTDVRAQPPSPSVPGVTLELHFRHPGGAVRLSAETVAPAPGVRGTIWIQDLQIKRSHREASDG